MAKSKKVGTKRPAAAKPSGKRAPIRPAKKPAAPPAKKAAVKPAKPTAKTAKLVKQAPPPSAKASVKAPPKVPAKPVKAAKPVVIVPPKIQPPAVLAPAPFRREYRRWKDLLISLRHRLLSEGSHLEEEGLKALEQEVSVDHMADFGSDSSEQETTLQLIESNSLSLRDVDDALKRIEAKIYGLCEECEQLIPSARLGVLPHARFCIACQSKREGMPA